MVLTLEMFKSDQKHFPSRIRCIFNGKYQSKILVKSHNSEKKTEKSPLGTHSRCKVVIVIEKDDIGSQKVKLEARSILKHPKLLKSVQ